MSDKIEDVFARHIHAYTPSQIADGILAGEFIRETEFVLAHEVERLRSALDTAIRERDEAMAEVDRQREQIKRLRVDLATQQNCCDGAAAQDAHVRQEREEHRAEVEKLRAEKERLKQEPELLRAELIALANAARKSLADAYDRARKALEVKP